MKGPDAARAELAARAAAAGEGAGRAPYVRAAAGLDFAEGRHDAAIAALRDLLAGLPPGDKPRNLEIVLAGMLAATGKQEESAALVEKVLAEDQATSRR